MKRRERGLAKQKKDRENAKASPKKRKTITGWRRWVFLTICLLFIPSFVLIVFESCLRILGFGYPTDFYIKRKFDHKTFFTENKKFGWRFFPHRIARRPGEQLISTSKDEKHVRIVLLGGSAAMGDPDPSFGFARILETILNSRFPDRRFEVINAAMTGINSHVVREIAYDTLKLKPDIFIIYAGNNEVVGPFGSGTVFSPFSGNLFLIRLKLWIETTKIGQILNSSRTFFRKSDDQPAVWGMNLFLKHKLKADDKKLEVTYRHFGKNLSDICKAAQNCGANTILCTVAANLRSCPPFASLHSPRLTHSGKAEWERLFRSGIEKESRKRYDDALLLYLEALKIDDTHADLHFRLGNCFWEKGLFEKARNHFLLARDYDCLRFRADSRINKVIRNIASKHETILVDAAEEIEAYSRNNIPGDDLFYDHVHFKFSGNYRMACLLAKSIEEKITPSASGEMPDETACAAYLACTVFDQRRISNLMLERMSLPPFTNQMNHSDMIEQRRRQLRQLGMGKESPALRASISTYRKALENRPEDWVLYENFAHLLQNTDQALEEADKWRNVLNLLPHHPERWASLGQALARAGNYQESIEACEKALIHDPENATAHNGLGMAYAGLLNMEKAKAHYYEALRLKPDYLDARHNLGILFSRMGDSNQVIENFSKIVSLNPDDPDSHFNLGLEWAKLKNYEKAGFHFSEVLRINPVHVEALYNLGFVYTEKKEWNKAIECYTQALKFKPDYANAHNNLGTLYARMGVFPKAIHHFSEILRINPDDPEIHYNLGLAFSNQGEREKAVDHFERLVQAAPQHARGHYQLGLNLERSGRITDALEHYRKALDLESDWAEVENQLAWALATYPRPQIRDSEESLRMAQKACRHTEFKDPSYLDTLAAAYASSGRYREALETSEKALNLALSSNLNFLAEEIKKRMELYKQGLPFYESDKKEDRSSQ